MDWNLNVEFKKKNAILETEKKYLNNIKKIVYWILAKKDYDLKKCDENISYRKENPRQKESQMLILTLYPVRGQDYGMHLRVM